MHIHHTLVNALVGAGLLFAFTPDLQAIEKVLVQAISSSAANTISFDAQTARFVRFLIKESSSGEPCIDELEVYGPDGKRNLALASNGAKIAVSSSLTGHSIHQIAHLNDGLYGNDHSWIAGSTKQEWVQIELPAPTTVAKVVFSRDRSGKHTDRVPVAVAIQLSLDGSEWKTVREIKAPGSNTRATSKKLVPLVPPPATMDWDGLRRYAFLCEKATWQRMNTTDHLSPLKTDRPALPDGKPYWNRIATLGPVARTFLQMEELIGRLEEKGLKLADEKKQLTQLQEKHNALAAAPAKDADTEETLYLEARQAKRQLMFRDPDLTALQKILFVKRHPYLQSHNYSDVLDSQFKSGGGICVLNIPHKDGRLVPENAQAVTLFDGSGGIARDPMADFTAEKIYFAYRPEKNPVENMKPYWHVMVMNADGSQTRQLSDGPFHDYYPCPLPDGGISFISTRCKARFLCWRPQAFVLFRMDASGENIRPLSFANISEWSPVVMRDGRIMWTRSEYIDKGANFSHTLWAIHPDGTVPELVYGNNTINCYLNAREVPGSHEIVCTIISHGGDHNGPIGLIDRNKGPSDPTALTSITPDVVAQYDMNWLRQECFRDPAPVSRDYFLASHASGNRFDLYLIDRYGNRELLYFDPVISSMCPTVLAPEKVPPILPPASLALDSDVGQFIIADVYQGLEPLVQRGKVKYIRVCQEIRSELEQLPKGEFRNDHPPYLDFYATPVHKVSGPFGWPSYVAKASLGLATVEVDGSASFYAPARKVLYFQVLDENFNELQRMRSVIQLQPGEKRSCIGCHENRQSSAPAQPTIAARRAPQKLQEPSWGTQALSYERVVQPVLDAKCIRCHNAEHKRKIDLTGELDANRVPISYRTLIAGGWVHYFNCGYGVRPYMAAPLSFGTLQSRLWKTLNAGHNEVKLSSDDIQRIKCWIDMNCPLWPDYIQRNLRPEKRDPIEPRKTS